MPTKTARRDYNKLLPGSDTSQTQTTPPSRTCNEVGEAMLCCLEKRKKKLGVHEKIYSYLNRDSVF